MKANDRYLKLLAIKIYFLNQSQRAAVASLVGGLPILLERYLNEIGANFPQLKYLTDQQRHVIYKNIMAEKVAQCDWELLRERVESIKQTQPQYPSKLFAMIFEN